jgi:hypothetical protein
MRLYEIYTCPASLRSMNISCSSHSGDILNRPSKTKSVRKLEKMSKEIKRDETNSHLQVPIQYRNEYFDDEYAEVSDNETESELLRRELNRLKLKRRANTKRKK